MAVVTMRQLLAAGVHFGHQTRRWNPKMRRYILGERNGIYLIDLHKTLEGVDTAYGFVRDLVAGGGNILFVGTKKQTQGPVAEFADACGMPYVNQRWLGGMLTNFTTVSGRVKRMQELRAMQAAGDFDAMPKKEALRHVRELEKLQPQPGRHQRAGPAARRHLRDRHEEGAHRGDRGQQAGPAGGRRGRHQLRPRRHHLRHPGQRRRHPFGRPHVPGHGRRRDGGPLDRHATGRLRRPPRPEAVAQPPAPGPVPPRPSGPSRSGAPEAPTPAEAPAARRPRRSGRRWHRPTAEAPGPARAPAPGGPAAEARPGRLGRRQPGPADPGRPRRRRARRAEA